MSSSDKVSVYDSLDADVVQSYMEYSLASMIYYCMKEGATSEQSSRMSAMDNSSKNAGMNNEHHHHGIVNDAFFHKCFFLFR